MCQEEKSRGRSGRGLLLVRFRTGGPSLSLISNCPRLQGRILQARSLAVNWTRCSIFRSPLTKQTRVAPLHVLVDNDLVMYSLPQSPVLGLNCNGFQKPSTGLTCRSVPGRRCKINFLKFVIFHPLAQKTPVDGSAPNLEQP